MSIQTYRIIGSTLAIPGVPGEWHAGQEVDVDSDTNTVVATRLLPTTPEDADTEQPSEQQSLTVHVSLDDQHLFSATTPSTDFPTVAVKEATGQEKTPAPDETGGEEGE